MTRVLVPVEILEGESVSYGLMNLLGTMDVTVLGYHVLPEQTPADQAREQFEERAVSALEDLAQEFREAGGDAESRLVFTHDREQTVDRVADDVDARAYALTGATGDVDRLLVPIAGDVAVDRILDFVTELVGDRDITVTLFLASEADGADALLEKAADRLEASGITAETDLVVSGQPFEALINAVPGHDAIVIGDQAPSLSTFLRGDEAERVAAASVGPVLVVRSERTAAESLGE
jgi:nucleotide-binding universal stress UspA family protein